MIEARAVLQQHVDGWPVPQLDRPDDRGGAFRVLGLGVGAVLQHEREAVGPLQRREEPRALLPIPVIEIDAGLDQFHTVADADLKNQSAAILAAAAKRKAAFEPLIAWHEQAALTAGIGTVYVEARADNAQTRAFYRKLGYTEVQRVARYYDGVEDAVRLARDLWK